MSEFSGFSKTQDAVRLHCTMADLPDSRTAKPRLAAYKALSPSRILAIGPGRTLPSKYLLGDVKRHQMDVLHWTKRSSTDIPKKTNQLQLSKNK